VISKIKFNHEGHQKNEKYISDSGKDRSFQYPVMMQQSLAFVSTTIQQKLLFASIRVFRGRQSPGRRGDRSLDKTTPRHSEAATGLRLCVNAQILKTKVRRSGERQNAMELPGTCPGSSSYSR
jgi:hypothetical protein